MDDLVVGEAAMLVKIAALFVKGLLTFLVVATLGTLVGKLVGNLVGFLVGNLDF